MVSWYILDAKNKLKRVEYNNAKIFNDKIVIDENGTITLLKTEYNFKDYLYGDVIFMIEKGNLMIPIQLPQKVPINPLYHPQVQEFIANQRKKLRMQIKKYEEILDSLKDTNYEEENFEKDFFKEFEKLRSELYKNSTQFLSNRLNLTKKEIENIVNKQNSMYFDSSEEFISVKKQSKNKSKLLKKVDPELKKLFEE
ncbi:MAG: hypothetical protein ACTSRZ_08005 [Promethearchaeota archaeon]